MRGYIFIALIIGLAGNSCIKREVLRVPTVTLKGESVLKCDTTNPNYSVINIGPVGRIQIDSCGNIWISDIRNARLLKYNAKGEYLSQINFAPLDSSGELPCFKYRNACDIGGLPQIWDFCIGRDGKLYAALAIKERGYPPFFIESFDLEGKKLGEIRIEEFPQRIAVDSKGLIYITYVPIRRDIINRELVMVYDSIGQRVDSFGTTLKFYPEDSGEALLYNRVWLSIDNEDNLWMAFEVSPIVRKYNSAHQLVFERRYITAETKRSLAKTEEYRKKFEKLKKKNSSAKPIVYGTFWDIITPDKDSIFLITIWNVAYRLDGNGDIKERIVLDDKIRDYTRFAISPLGEFWECAESVEKEDSFTILHFLKKKGGEE